MILTVFRGFYNIFWLVKKGVESNLVNPNGFVEGGFMGSTSMNLIIIHPKGHTSNNLRRNTYNSKTDKGFYYFFLFVLVIRVTSEFMY